MILEHIEQVESIVVSVEYKPEAGGNLRTFNTATTAAVMAFHMFVIKEHLEEEIRKGGSSNAEHNENVAS